MNVIGGLPIRAKVLLLAGIPVAGTLILAVVIAQRGQSQTAAAAALGSIEDVAQLSVRISSVIHALQLERARAALDAGSRLRDPRRTPGSDFDHRFEATNQSVRRLDTFLEGHDLSALPAQLARDLKLARVTADKRQEFRDRLAQEEVSIGDILDFYDKACDALITATAALTGLSDDGELLRSISSLVALAHLTERASREHALLGYVFAAGTFPPGSFKMLVTLTTERSVYDSTFRAGAHGDAGGRYASAQADSAAERVRAMRDVAMRSTLDELDVDPHAWFAAATDELESLHAIEQGLLGRITSVASVKQAATRASVRFGWLLSIAVVLASGALAWFIARGVTRSIVDLSSAAARVRATNDFSVRAQKSSADELGALTETFNAMLTMIEQRDRHLEAQVAERTEELRETLAELWSEMDLATKIQTVLLPQEPDLPSYDISAKMVPASSVGGDYYDVLRVAGVDWILIGDVSGHGVTAGLTMMLVQTAVRTVLLSAGEQARELTPSELLTHVNASVRANIQKINTDQYMTIMALRLDGRTVRYAGLHQDVLVYRSREKRVERLETRGIWIGLLDDISELLEEDVFEVDHGDVIFLYTDGVTEFSVQSELLGTDGLADMLTRLANGGPTPGELVEGVAREVCVGTPDDDITVLAARYDADKARRGADRPQDSRVA